MLLPISYSALVQVVSYLKLDLSRAYRQLAIDPWDYHFLGFTFDDLLFFDIFFAFGLRPATMACQRTTNAIMFLYLALGYFCTNYIDDFGGCDTPARASDAFHALKWLFHELGISTSADKDLPPSTSMIFLGILIDTIAMTLSVPASKLTELVQCICSVLRCKQISFHQLQPLLGLLSFVTACVHPAHIFISALLNGLSGLAHSCHLLITPEIHSDLEWWLHFLPHYNGVSLILPPTFTPHIIVTDACYDGAGGHFGNYCFHGQFPTEIRDTSDFDINVKELLAIIVALRLWGPNMAGQCLLLHSDNQDAVLALNNRCSRSPLIQQCLHIIWFLCETFDFDTQAEHIPGYINVIADLLSHWYSDVNPSFSICQDQIIIFFKNALQRCSTSHLISLLSPVLTDILFSYSSSVLHLV